MTEADEKRIDRAADLFLVGAVVRAGNLGRPSKWSLGDWRTFTADLTPIQRLVAVLFGVLELDQCRVAEVVSDLLDGSRPVSRASVSLHWRTALTKLKAAALRELPESEHSPFDRFDGRTRHWR